MYDPLVYQVALTLIPGIGAVQAKILLQHFNPEEIFRARASQLEKIEGIGSFRANAIRKFRDFSRAENEIAFVQSRKIRTLFIGSEDYPKRLLQCYDPPTLLYLKGEIDLNAPRVIAVIGTRRNSAYGAKMTEEFIASLAGTGTIIVSGLAYGIDALAHRGALKHGLPTLGVLAHGLNHLYPPEHIPIAKEMIKAGGGLLTEFNSFSKPDKHNFPVRNRIVAGLCDAVVVIETGKKGGSMITAELANGYHRDVFAFPGRATDGKSEGCHQLIRNNKAVLISDAEELLEAMGWKERPAPVRDSLQRELFATLSPEETAIVELLKTRASTHIDEISFSSGLSLSQLASGLLSLEFKGIISSLPGKAYRLN